MARCLGPCATETHNAPCVDALQRDILAWLCEWIVIFWVHLDTRVPILGLAGLWIAVSTSMALWKALISPITR